MNPTKLRLKIKAQNELAKNLNQIVPRLLAAIAPFVGEKIVLASGEFSKKFKTAVSGICGHTPAVMSYLSKSNYSVRVVVRASTWENDDNASAEDSYTICELENGAIKKITTMEPLKDDWDFDFVQGKRAEAEAAKKEFERILAMVPYLFRDNY